LVNAENRGSTGRHYPATMASAFSTRDPADPDDTSRNCCFNVIFQWIMQGFEGPPHDPEKLRRIDF
jgi:hypothetical protein